jgi:hypothetical protein
VTMMIAIYQVLSEDHHLAVVADGGGMADGPQDAE